MNLQNEDNGSQLYWRLTESLLADPSVSRGTMMGLPCMRMDGAFFASLDRGSHHLIVKLPAARVAELVTSGTGLVFAPSNRPFREWVAIPRPDAAIWAELLDEAKVFVGPGVDGRGEQLAGILSKQPGLSSRAPGSPPPATPPPGPRK